MAYTKKVWNNEPVTPALLDHLETQYENAIIDLLPILRTDTTKTLVIESSSSAPAHGAGRMYFNTTDGLFYISDGANWLKIGGD